MPEDDSREGPAGCEAPPHRTGADLWQKARSHFHLKGDALPLRHSNLQGVSTRLNPPKSTNAEDHSTSDADDSSDGDSSSASSDAGPHEAEREASGGEAGQAHKTRSHMRRHRRQLHGRGVVKMHASLHAHQEDSNKGTSLASRINERLHIWRRNATPRAAADRLKTAFTGASSDRQSGFTVPVPPLTIVMLVAGTRGDVQPFMALGKGLMQHGHRVRLATHAVYRDFVEGYGLEFYPLGGNPQVLSEYMVKNRGILPGGYNDIVTQRKELRDIVFSVWPACTEPDPDHPDKPFKAEAVIANPVCYGHEHCAEALNVPLHMVFTMPWSPTGEFAHPMARILYTLRVADSVAKRTTRIKYYTDVDEHYKELLEGDGGRRKALAGWAARRGVAIKRLHHRAMLKQMRTANRMSYSIIEDMCFQGVSDLLDKLRTEELGLPTMGHLFQIGFGYAHYYTNHKVPFTYAWSEAVAPRPKDWKSYIDVAGYFTLDSTASERYKPPKELEEFLAEHDPIYIGFGSLVVDDPEKLTRKIFAALKETGEAALIGKGWGNLGVIEGEEPPENVLLIDAVPHDWLFPRCKAVMHHGGAGTTAAGLMAACPTTVVPFFGDQSFWGEACVRAGVGPRPIPIGKLRTRKLVEAIRAMQSPEVQSAAKAIAEHLAKEDGVAKGVAAFHRHLPRRYLLDKRKSQGLMSDDSGSHSSWPQTLKKRLSRSSSSLGQYQQGNRNADYLAWLSVKAWWQWLRRFRPLPVSCATADGSATMSPTPSAYSKEDNTSTMQQRYGRAEGVRNRRQHSDHNHNSHMFHGMGGAMPHDASAAIPHAVSSPRSDCVTIPLGAHSS
ncbi:hypothetical protein WJX73_005456 [Symbiochloris irregularis]|uniref:Glycosyltransferase family 28 N-terminal domain-containing protein n=1 Tax=Symbiochloris irregularis TaxID=706552 RepID=A0AAW1P5Q9_9CHLO